MGGSMARPFSKEGLNNSEKSLSSYFTSLLPSATFGGRKSSRRQHDTKPLQSLPSKWRSKSFKWQENPLDSSTEYGPCNDKEIPNTTEEDEEHAASRNSKDADKFEEATTSHVPPKVVPDFIENSSFISSDLFEFFQSSLPNIVRGCQWVLLYSTLKHGISLRTLLRKSTDLPGPCLLIVGDMEGAVFGGLLECPLKPTPKRKYQGTNQTFVFTTIYGEPRLFRATGANRYFYLCLNDLLALGGGGNFALCLDGDLLRGTSGPCETFGNVCLARSPEFELKNVELWGFAHLSQYLT
ncbi:oxidation resistance protein 1 isoform X2 [Macadamia integrifolia]|uniref:oxidation resistance protein 1 isoform X2 n=1 Tax=Macadamia integrifolia TaxID=60698 RepID=UPI001C4F1FB0|nr:oxidation resistance protein 1 isoform X2 [Macadamia integrifolia]